MRSILIKVFFILIFFSSSSVFPVTLKALLIADTNDASIGQSVKTDLYTMKRELELISQYAGMKLDIKTMESNEVNNSNVVRAVKNLKVGPDDTLIFYFSGHGYRHSTKDTKWPMMHLKGGGLDFYWVATTLKAKNPRFMMVMTDSCNSYTDRSPLMDKTFRPIEKANSYRKLFAEARGSIIASASSPGEYAWGSSAGGAFSLKLLREIRKEAAGANGSWKNIVKEMNNPIGTGKYKQTPQVDYKAVTDVNPVSNQKVLAQWSKDKMWYPAKIVRIEGNDVKVQWYTGSYATVSSAEVKPFNWSSNDKIQCVWAKDKKYYNGKVADITPTHVTIRWDDGGNTQKTALGNCRSGAEAVTDLLQTGTIVLTKWSKDKMWYPARVVSSKTNKTQVKWLDGGSSVTVDNQNIKPFGWRVFTPLECKWSKDSKYYKGKVAKINSQNLVIRWDDGGNTETRSFKDCREGASEASASLLKPGTIVLSQWVNNNKWYPSIVKSVSGNSVNIIWNDGTKGTIKKDQVKKYTWQTGTPIECTWSKDNKYYPGKIHRLSGNDLTIKWDDGGNTEKRTLSNCRSQ